MNIDDKLEILKSEMKIKPAQLTISLENFIREYVEKLERGEQYWGYTRALRKRLTFEELLCFALMVGCLKQ